MNTNADGIAAAAMSSGVTAMREPNTTARTASAPAPASRVSASTLLPPPWPPEDRMLAPVTRTGAPSTRRPATARVSPGSAAVYGSLLAKSGTGYSSWNAVRPSAETKARPPVLTQDAARAPGSAAAALPNAAASCARRLPPVRAPGHPGVDRQRQDGRHPPGQDRAHRQRRRPAPAAGPERFGPGGRAGEFGPGRSARGAGGSAAGRRPRAGGNGLVSCAGGRQGGSSPLPLVRRGGPGWVANADTGTEDRRPVGP